MGHPHPAVTANRMATIAAQPRAIRWVNSTFAALEQRRFRVLWTGTAISFIGFMMSSTAQNVVAYDLSGNNRAVGLVMFGQGVAMLILSPVGGVLADRMSKRMLLMVSQATIGLRMLATALLIAAGLALWWRGVRYQVSALRRYPPDQRIAPDAYAKNCSTRTGKSGSTAEGRVEAPANTPAER